MDTFTAIKTRRSVRAFKPTKIPDDVLYAVLEAGHCAPAAWNKPNWRFLVVESEEKKKAIVKSSLGQTWIAQAPVVIIVCSEPDSLVREGGARAKKLFQIQNVAAAVENILIAATNFGLGACWVGAFTEPGIRKEFQIHNDAEIHAIIPLGYPAIFPKAPNKPAFADVTYFEKWENQQRGPEPKTLGEHMEGAQKTVSGKLKSALGKLKKKK